MDRWPFGQAPVNYINYLLELQKKHGDLISNVSIKPSNGIYIGKGSPWANPYRGSNSIIERINNIYNFDRYYRLEFLKEDSPLHFKNVWYTFKDRRPIVCYCNDGTNIQNPQHLCHGLIYLASLTKAMELTFEAELKEVFDKKE